VKFCRFSVFVPNPIGLGPTQSTMNLPMIIVAL
jgi:hypothetical protein